MFAGAKTFSRFIPSFIQRTNEDTEYKASARRVANVSASSRLFRSYSVAVLAIFVIGAVNPANAYSSTSLYSPALEGVDQYYHANDLLLLTTDDGYIPKITPQTEFSDRSAMNGHIIHNVESGDTISTIAEEYGLKMNTVLWENGLAKTSTLKVGQKLVIPPVDGVTHVVTKGQDIKKIATLYGVTEGAILKQNRLDADVALKSGEALFIPGAKPLPVITRSTPSRVSSSTRLGRHVGSTVVVPGSSIGAASTETPAVGKSMIWPTRGVITQGYHSGHYAIDIAERDKPPIWAAMDGTVVKASSGTWGGGYGNYIMIDHGNGLKTRYAHAEYLSVGVGDVVKQGQVIAKMGNTGNVRGRTGIHLHFEVIKNGVKQNPFAYLPKR